MSATVHGLEALRRKLKNPTWLTRPMGGFLDRWRFWTQGAARENTPVDTGRLRNSVQSERDHGAFPTWAKVGTNVHYAPYVHEGTRPHWPPPDAVAPWARRHGIEPFLVAQAIATRGTKGRPFLKNAAAASEPRIGTWLAQMAREIEAEASA